jgi:hypothetical protein
LGGFSRVFPVLEGLPDVVENARHVMILSFSNRPDSMFCPGHNQFLLHGPGYPLRASAFGSVSFLCLTILVQKASNWTLANLDGLDCPFSQRLTVA